MGDLSLDPYSYCSKKKKMLNVNLLDLTWCECFVAKGYSHSAEAYHNGEHVQLQRT